MERKRIAAAAGFLLVSVALGAQGKGRVVEAIIAWVNNDIITLSDYEKAQTTLRQEVEQDCQGCPQAKIDETYKEQAKNLLRDLIDQSLLVQKAKDLGISVETDVVKQLDQVRQQNNLPSMEALEKAVEGQGASWEDYKASIRRRLLTQAVIRREVTSRIFVGNDEVKKYYQGHKSEFVRPEEVFLSEIFLSTQGKTPEEVQVIRKKADGLLARIRAGEDFAGLAKRYSEGSTAKDGGELGAFKRGQLSKQLEDVVFKMNRKDVTDVIQTRTGFEILRVDQHYQAGLQPMDKVENEILNRLYSRKMEPALRDYLAELREESYVVIKPGYVDTAAGASNATIQEVPATPDSEGKKKKKGKRAGQ